MIVNISKGNSIFRQFASSVIFNIKGAVRSVGPLHRLVNRLRQHRLHEPRFQGAVVLFGAGDGAFGVLGQSLNRLSIVYSAGVGDDVAFEEALIARVGCTVHAFDPAPATARWIEQRIMPQGFNFHAVGLAAFNGTENIHMTLRATDQGGAKIEQADCPVVKLSSLMSQLGHARIDLLKLHIEGGEYQVINDMLASNIKPDLLIVAYHHKMYGIQPVATRNSVRDLKKHGYQPYWISNNGHEYGFARAKSDH